MGLSPRVRGNPPNHRPAGQGARSIPACAGEPMAADTISAIRRVYPRVCGGTPCSDRYSPTGVMGLSPRVRGNHERVQHCGGQQWSIPACAGEPAVQASRRGWCGVYPRVCGGTNLGLRGLNSVGGLSPRVRGNPPAASASNSSAGSIPACAGEPAPGRERRRRCRVYPRVCGGTRFGVTVNVMVLGLSPRVRGNRVLHERAAFSSRSIPACAGEPASRSGRTLYRQVYPRVCGGTSRNRPSRSTETGLSPRVRGNLN